MAGVAPTESSESAPFFTITSTDQGGVIVIVSALCLAIAVLSILIRAYVRWEFTPRRFAWDDFFVAAALVVSICQSATVFLEVHNGLGQSEEAISFTQSVNIQKTIYADEILYIVAVWLTKISVAFLLLRLSPKVGHIRASRFNLGFLLISAVTCILLLALKCDLSRPWLSFDDNLDFCTNLYARFQTLAGLDITTEAFLFATAMYMILSLQMVARKKCIILFAFSLRLLLIAPISLHLYYIKGANKFVNPTLQLTRSSLCKQIEICYAIVAATIPVLRPFMVALTTHYGAIANGSLSAPATQRGTGRSTQEQDLSGLKESTTTTSTSTAASGGRRSGTATRTKSSTGSWPNSPTIGRPPIARLGQRSASYMEGVDSFGASYRADISSEKPDVRQMAGLERSSITVRTDVQMTIEYDDHRRTGAFPL